MNRNGLTAWLFLSMAFLGGKTQAEPVLLASFDNRVSRPASAPADPEVAIVLEISDFAHPATIGGNILWRNSEVGAVDISSGNDAAFARFAELATDGMDGILGDGVLWSRGGTLFTNSESVVFGRTPDLIWFQLDFVRVTVHDISFEPWTPPFPTSPAGFLVDYDATYDFYGQVVPEPRTLALLALGILAMHWRKF